MNRICLVLLSFVLFSCTYKKDAVFSEAIKDFPENRWKIDDIKVFKPVVAEDVKGANLYLNFSHIHQPGYKSVPVAIKWYGANGKEETNLVELKIEDENGKSLSDCAGDVCDVKVLVKEHVDFAKGKYKIAVMQKFNGEYLPNVLAVGVSIEKAE